MLSGKTVVITGASSGLGEALASAAAASGANLALLGRDAQKLAPVAGRCRSLGAGVVEVAGDVVEPGDCRRLVDAAMDEFGSVDYLVLNAGVSMWTLFEDVEDPEIFEKIMDTNYLGVVNCVYHGLEALKRSGGLVVAISSAQGITGVPWHTGYCASKHALQGFCDSLRIELKGTGVDVLTVMPSWIRGTSLRSGAYGSSGEAIGEAARDHHSSAVSLDSLVARVLKAMKKRKRSLFVPWYLRFVPLLKVLCPRFLDWVIGKKVTR